MTVTDLPTIPRPIGLTRLQVLTGTRTDDEAVNEAIRRIEQGEFGGESATDRGRKWLAETAVNPPIKSKVATESVLAAIDAGRENQLSMLRSS